MRKKKPQKSNSAANKLFASAMEYFIYTTKDCNLNCTFCSNAQKRKSMAKAPNAKQTADFVLRDSMERKNADNTVVFFGGEPLLNQKFMLDFVKQANGKKLRYIAYTNGTLLDKLCRPLLDRLDVLFVSIDGNHCAQDTQRGKGTFEKIIRNMYKIRSSFAGQTVARLCFLPEYSIYSSVLGVVNWFDHVHWQIENPLSEKNNSQEWLEKYSGDLDLLIEFWISHLQKGIVKNIIPFQAISHSIISNEIQQGFRCGAGKSIMAISTSGKCFVCDDLVEREEFHIGDIQQGINNKKMHNLAVNTFCSECNIQHLCGGRCLRAWREFKHQTRYYCRATKMLVEKIQKQAPLIKELLENKTIPQQALKNPLSKFTEQIP